MRSVWSAVRLALVTVCALQSEAVCVDPRAIHLTLQTSGTAAKPSAACRIWAGEVSSCGAFRPSPGVSKVWIEDRNVISPRPLEVTFDHACGSELQMPVVAAGVVDVATDGARPMHLVHVAGLEEGLERAIESAGRVRMPLGPTVAVALDRQERVAAVSRPFTVRSDRVATLAWAHAAVSAVVLIFDVAPAAAGEPFELLADGQTRPDVLLTHRGRHLGIWYALTGPDARITVASKRVHMEPVTVTTDRRGIANAHGTIRPLPALTVNVTIPEEVRSALDDAVLTVSGLAGNEPLVRSGDVTGTQRFAALPPQVLKAVLEIGSHKLTRTVDLSRGDDATIDFALQPYVVSGVVSHGDERAKARIEFRRDDSIHTKSDASGRYEVVLWEGGKYVAEVKLEDEPGVPSHLDLVNVDHSTTTLDFHIPRAIHRVRVLDDQTGVPIAGALITVFNSWNDPEQGPRRVGRNVATGPQGEALLPGLRAGTAEVHASAEGYQGADPVNLVAGPGQPARTIEIRLRPREASRTASVLLPDGSAAVGARLSALSAGVPVWSGMADKDGTVAIPSTLHAEMLLASHPGAGLFAGRWTGGAQPLTVRLPPAAAPVVVKVVRSDGSAARFAPVTIWLDGLPISDPALAVFTGAVAATDAEGVWVGRNLPAAGFRIAAVRSRSRTGNPAAIEPLATQVPFPWPGVVTIRTAD